MAVWDRSVSYTHLRLSMAKWYNKVEEAGFHAFNVIAATFYEHYDDIPVSYTHLDVYKRQSQRSLAARLATSRGTRLPNAG